MSDAMKSQWNAIASLKKNMLELSAQVLASYMTQEAKLNYVLCRWMSVLVVGRLPSSKWRSLWQRAGNARRKHKR